MIDWITVVVPYAHDREISGGAIASFDQHGELQWHRRKFAHAIGTYDQTVALQSSADHAPGTHVWISGCPAKFLQGHNCFGFNDLTELVARTAKRALEVHGFEVTDLDVRRWRNGEFTLSTVDITEHYSMPTQADSLAAIRFIGQHATMKHRGGGVMKEGTVYFGKHSRRWAVKIYNKYLEIQSGSKGHGLPDELPFRNEVVAWCLGDVRFELRLCSMELKKRGLNHGSAWVGRDPRGAFNMYIGKLEIPHQTQVSTSELEGLPAGARLAYLAWKRGEDVRGSISRMTFWRYRRALLSHGIDISTAPKDSGGTVIDMGRVIRANPKDCPDWAFGNGILGAA